MISLRDCLLAGDQRGRRLPVLEGRLGPQPGKLQRGNIDPRDSVTRCLCARGVRIRERVAEMPASPVGMALDDRNPALQWATTLR
jgi:hypothetical protein